jgi:hypothetical protein
MRHFRKRKNEPIWRGSNTASPIRVGQDYFAELQLNKPFLLKLPEIVGLAGEGSFQNKQVELTWAGPSERNGEACAVIHYRARFNRVQVDSPGFAMQGRSH